jgi:glycosyltransferase involved in cell wall biosynthesis
MSRRLHIVAVHGYYQLAGGEDSVFEDEVRLLREHGHTVTCWTKSNSDLEQYNSATALVKSIWNRDSYREFSGLLQDRKPDIVHCHNTFGIISPAVYSAASSHNIPVVQTLHNYRYCCLNALLFRNSKVCEECVGKVLPLSGLFHRCYREKLAPSAGMFALQAVHRMLGTWKRYIAGYIALTESAKERFVRCGLPAEKIYVKPNFVFDSGSRKCGCGEYALFAGRLSAEKGIRVLSDTWNRLHDIPLKVAGQGPLESVLANRDNIELLGWLNHEKLVDVIKGARFVVVPSDCYEQFPVAVIEAFCCGVPVLVSDHGAQAELVRNSGAGGLFTAGNASAMAAAAESMWHDDECCRSMGAAARRAYEHKYSPAENYRCLLDIYMKVIDRL